MQAIQWEYREYIQDLIPSKLTLELSVYGGDSTHNETSASFYFWQQIQPSIRFGVQQWIDRGWQPLGEIGPSSLIIQVYDENQIEALGCILVILFTLVTFGFGILLLPIMAKRWRHRYARPVVFRLSMRRRV